MPLVSKDEPSEKAEKRIKLREVKPGDYFRFPDTSYEEALVSKDEACFYMVVKQEPKKAGRVQIVSADGQILAERDDDREVIVHPAKLKIGPAEAA
jgi:hypothetical protein